MLRIIWLEETEEDEAFFCHGAGFGFSASGGSFCLARHKCKLILVTVATGLLNYFEKFELLNYYEQNSISIENCQPKGASSCLLPFRFASEQKVYPKQSANWKTRNLQDFMKTRAPLQSQNPKTKPRIAE